EIVYGGPDIARVEPQRGEGRRRQRTLRRASYRQGGQAPPVRRHLFPPEVGALERGRQLPIVHEAPVKLVRLALDLLGFEADKLEVVEDEKGDRGSGIGSLRSRRWTMDDGR